MTSGQRLVRAMLALGVTLLVSGCTPRFFLAEGFGTLQKGLFLRQADMRRAAQPPKPLNGEDAEAVMERYREGGDKDRSRSSHTAGFSTGGSNAQARGFVLRSR